MDELTAVLLLIPRGSRVEGTYRTKVVGVPPLTEDMVRLASGGLFVQQSSSNRTTRGARSYER